jgi:hypothetical protein
MKKTLLLISCALTGSLFAQTALPTATLELTLPCSGGTGNRSGIAYNPNQQLYYSVNAGSSGYQIETFDAMGNPVSSTTQGFDYRGCWWNPNTNTLEGNGFSSNGIWIQNLDGSFYPLSTGTVDLPGVSGPNSQSCADYDYMDDEILYHNSGTIYRYSRASHTLISSNTISGLPVPASNLNYTSVAYTGIPGMEIGVYDYITKAFYFIDKSTGAYQYTCTLPGSAPGQNYLKMGFENEYVWIYDGSQTWYGYKVLEQCSASASSLTEVVCDSYLSPAGNTYNTTGMYYDTIPNAAGCDSIITIDLTVQNTTNTLIETACDSYMSPAGNTYNATGMYYDTIPNAAGCDSIITIDLTIIPNNLDNSVTQNGSQLLANQLVAAYQWIDCENGNTPILGEVNQVFEPTSSGIYAVEITAGGCTITSDCISIDLTGIPELENEMTMYPNPATEYIGFEHDFGSVDVRIVSMNGQLVVEKENVKEQLNVSHLQPGAYFVEISSDSKLWKKLLVKQ